MKPSLIKHLVSKDWQLNRSPLIAYTLVGIVAAIMFGIPNGIAFYSGMVILITAFAVTGIHMVFATVIGEYKDNTLPFIMSLPVSFRDYTKAKLIANLSVVLAVWGIILTAVYIVVLSRENVHNGIIPFITITVLELLVVYALILFVAMISESEVYTIVVMTLGNMSISIFMFWLASFKEINAYMSGPMPVWNNTAIQFVLAESALFAVIIAMTFYLQSRKDTFI